MLPNNNAKMTEETRKTRPFFKAEPKSAKKINVPAAINANKIFCPNSLLHGKYYPIKRLALTKAPPQK